MKNMLGMTKQSVILCLLVGVLSTTLFALAQPAEESDQTAADSPSLEITVYTEGPIPKNVKAEIPFEWRIIVRWYGELNALVPEIQKQPSFEGASVLTSSTTLKNGVEENRRYAEKIYTYRLLAEQPGPMTVGSAAIRVQEESESEEEAYLTTNRTTIDVQAAPFSLRRFSQKIWENRLIRILIVIFIIVVVTIVTLIWSIRFRRQVPQQPVEEVKSPSEEALESATRARIEGDMRKYVQSLEKAVRLSFEERYPDGNDVDLFSYKERIEPEFQPIFERFFRFCEETKFSPVTPSPDVLDQAWNDAKRLMGE